jgi:ATP-dependent RNA helicase RhlE
VEVTPQSTPVERIDQSVMHVDGGGKIGLLADLLADSALSRVIVFSRTKHGANRIAEQLGKRGIPSAAIHGNKSQGARQRALADFKTGRMRVLVATDIAARGIDIDAVSHVVNFELPNLPESYVHRIGRTARAGAAGIAISFCDASERMYLRDIEKLLGRRLTVIGEGPKGPDAAPAESKAGRRNGGGRPSGNGSGKPYGKSNRGSGGYKAGGGAPAGKPRRRPGRNGSAGTGQAAAAR